MEVAWEEYSFNFASCEPLETVIKIFKIRQRGGTQSNKKNGRRPAAGKEEAKANIILVEMFSKEYQNDKEARKNILGACELILRPCLGCIADSCWEIKTRVFFFVLFCFFVCLFVCLFFYSLSWQLTKSLGIFLIGLEIFAQSGVVETYLTNRV